MAKNTGEKKKVGEEMPNPAQQAEKVTDNNTSVDSSENTMEKKSAVKNGIVRMVLVLLSILLEVVVIFLLLHYLGSKAGWVYSVIHILSMKILRSPTADAQTLYGTGQDPSTPSSCQ